MSKRVQPSGHLTAQRNHCVSAVGVAMVSSQMWSMRNEGSPSRVRPGSPSRSSSSGLIVGLSTSSRTVVDGRTAARQSLNVSRRVAGRVGCCDDR